jgi:uncharacterized protein (TIGR03435 family)
VKILLLFALGLPRPIAYAQNDSPAGNLPEFEVATIKPTNPNAPSTFRVRVYPGGRLIIHGVALKGLVAAAFDLSYWQISGGDAWVEKDQYDIEAKPAENSASRIKSLRYTWERIEDEYLREMLQTLLIDRFRLRFHRETRTGNLYLLERSGKPLPLSPAETDSLSSRSPEQPGFSGEVEFVGGRWFLFRTSMPQLAKFAADYVLRVPVLDRTELGGVYDYKEPAPLSDTNDDAGFFDSFPRLIREIGLKLERSQGPIESLVIDHAERPSPN